MKITRAQLKQIIKEEIEEMARGSDDVRALGGSDLSPTWRGGMDEPNFRAPKKTKSKQHAEYTVTNLKQEILTVISKLTAENKDNLMPNLQHTFGALTRDPVIEPADLSAAQNELKSYFDKKVTEHGQYYKKGPDWTALMQQVKSELLP